MSKLSIRVLCGCFAVASFVVPSGAIAESCESAPGEMLATPSCERQSTETDGVTKYWCKNNSCGGANSTKKCVLKVVTEDDVVTDRTCLCKTPVVAAAAGMESVEIESSDSSIAKW